MCRGLSVIYKITTRRSTIDVRKKSDLSRKNWTTGSPGHVRKIWVWPQPDKVDGPKASNFSYNVTRMRRQILRIKFYCFLFAFPCPKVLPWHLVNKMTGFRTLVTQRMAYCDVGAIYAHNMATRVGMTSVQNEIHCLAQYVCRKWQIIVWHNFYRWWLELPHTWDMKCDCEINHANFLEVRANIFRVI